MSILSILEPPIEFFLPDKLIDHPAGTLHEPRMFRILGSTR